MGLFLAPGLQAQMAGISPGVTGLRVSTILITGNAKTRKNGYWTGRIFAREISSHGKNCCARGFRWEIEAFVKTDLFLDYGYDFEENDGKLYGGISLPF